MDTIAGSARAVLLPKGRRRVQADLEQVHFSRALTDLMHFADVKRERRASLRAVTVKLLTGITLSETTVMIACVPKLP